MTEIAELLRAIASLLWPILAFIALLFFRSHIRVLFGRLKKGKLLGQEIELHDSLLMLEVKAKETASAAAALPAAGPRPADEPDLERRILDEAARSPKAALLLLASELERYVLQVLASMGHLREEVHPITLSQGLEALERHGGLPRHIGGAAKLFYGVRNKLIHGRDSGDDDVLSAIDSGLTIWRSIQAIPREANFVAHTDIPIYEDKDGTKTRSGITGVMLETCSPGGARTNFRIFPTTRRHFTVGKRVAWEWNMDYVTGESWYRDPDTQEIRHGWSQAAEFVGRHLEDV